MSIRASLRIVTVLFTLLICVPCSAMKIAVVTMAVGEQYEKCVGASIENKRRYCQRHGYDFICSTQLLDATRSIQWSKILLVQSLLETQKYDWVFWTDADSLIMNPNIKLESFIDPAYSVILTKDFNILHTSQVLYKNCAWSKEFLKKVYARLEFINHAWHAHAAFNEEYLQDEKAQKEIQVLPQRTFNSYAEDLTIPAHVDKSLVLYQPGDFIVHLPGMEMHALGAALTKYAARNDSPFWEKTEYIWNLGIASACDIGPAEDPVKLTLKYGDPTPRLIKEAFDKVKSGDVVWVTGYLLPLFCEEFLPKIKVPVVLVINDADDSFPSSFFNKVDIEKLLANENIIHIFAQNCDYKGLSTKVSHLPIGIDFHSIAFYKGGYWGESGSPRQQEEVLNAILKELPPTHLRKKMAFVDFQHNDTIRYGGGNRYLEFGEDRSTIFKQLLNTGLIEHGPRVKRSDLWKIKGQYAFSVSPHGNGLDCHRTWEDLVLGCIVIVKTSPLDPLYEGLPVVIVKNWSEVNQENMEQWLAKYSDASTNPEYRKKLTHAYWWSKIQAFALPYKG